MTIMTLRGASVALSAVLSLSLAPMAHASVTFFTSESSFLAADPGATFHGFSAQGQPFVGDGDPVVANGLTFLDNTTAADLGDGGAPLLFTISAGSTPDYGVDFLSLQNTDRGVNATISGMSEAFAFNFGSYVSTGGLATITLSTGDSVTVRPGVPSQFFGFTSTTPVTSITINYARGLAFDIVNVAAAPEPAEWALMLLGFGALGAMARRRRSAAAG